MFGRVIVSPLVTLPRRFVVGQETNLPAAFSTSGKDATEEYVIPASQGVKQSCAIGNDVGLFARVGRDACRAARLGGRLGIVDCGLS